MKFWKWYSSKLMKVVTYLVLLRFLKGNEFKAAFFGSVGGLLLLSFPFALGDNKAFGPIWLLLTEPVGLTVLFWSYYKYG